MAEEEEAAGAGRVRQVRERDDSNAEGSGNRDDVKQAETQSSGSARSLVAQVSRLLRRREGSSPGPGHDLAPGLDKDLAQLEVDVHEPETSSVEAMAGVSPRSNQSSRSRASSVTSRASLVSKMSQILSPPRPATPPEPSIGVTEGVPATSPLSQAGVGEDVDQSQRLFSLVGSPVMPVARRAHGLAIKPLVMSAVPREAVPATGSSTATAAATSSAAATAEDGVGSTTDPRLISLELAWLGKVSRAVAVARTAVGPVRDAELRHLFANLCAPLEAPVLARLLRYGPEKYGYLDALEEPPRYYQILADIYVDQNDTAVAILLTSLSRMWGNDFIPAIFAALFYRRVFAATPENTMRLCNNLLRGCNRLFWYDVSTAAHVFAPVYRALQDDVLLNCDRIPSGQSLRDLMSLLFRFHPYYAPASAGVASSRVALRAFLDQVAESRLQELRFDRLPRQQHQLHQQPQQQHQYEQQQQQQLAGDAASTVMSVAEARILVHSLFAEETAVRQLPALEHEAVCIAYLRFIHALAALDLTPDIEVRIRSVLYDFSIPGAPRYASRQLRHEALRAMAAVFPRGAWIRRLLYVFFRSLHPYYAFASFLHHATSPIRSAYRRIRSFSWRRLLSRTGYQRVKTE